MALAPGTTLADALEAGAGALTGTSPTARLDCRLLLQHVTGLSHTELIGWPDHTLGAEESAHFEALVSRRAAGEPLAQITGEKEFWGLTFEVTGDVLSPRPDSETLIEAARELCLARPPQTILDLGTGSGCLLAALLTEFTQARGVAVDLSAAALAVAARNFEALGLGARVEVQEHDFAQPVAGRFDLIVSNPPYIAQGERDSLAVEIRNYEPAMALFAGEKGLDAYRILSHMLPQQLAENGIAIIEAGAGQAGDIESLMKSGFAAQGREISVVTRNDLAGHARAVAILPVTDAHKSTRSH
ncbi:peptide chain release factor N(5)-glutamine methyltransferase [Aquisalinus flavus]|uniref:Release factor glutamine methyltransferase n=1 Tax=Aquisalinus flavus TaxID=1526572 RepID=A0A8J2V493_9PROT|nr:peptide chain release factor N(5)-glutamine methyltransferase [Aquisalinus flavus]MBD0427850.1 peptide chain release factor N(5)-glutamine methyltransferase [Aquisalinus flavus]UNE47616.1 peptide chain release factor N(5)-glutamine methyltransferase [Aquisalinus flavus]GGD04364.1 release factor glutamine methyltransferase [Aquisalinus flavus]